MGVWIGVAVGLGLVALAGYLIMRLRGLQATVDDSWQQVLLAMRRRRDIVAELAEAVRDGSGDEVDLVLRVDEAIAVADLPGASPEQQAMAERDLEAVLAELSDAVAKSPTLNENPEATALRRRLGDADRRVEARRSVYERTAYALRRRASSVPGRWVARPLGIQAAVRSSEE